jgi:hypothetical protein
MTRDWIYNGLHNRRTYGFEAAHRSLSRLIFTFLSICLCHSRIPWRQQDDAVRRLLGFDKPQGRLL